MTTQARLILDILSPWHPGSGLGDGACADAVVHASDEGLPELPGRTVKGLLRAAVALGEESGVVPKGTASLWFGRDGRSEAPGRATNADEVLDELEASRFSTSLGRLRVESARPGLTDEERRAWQQWARDGADADATLATLRIRLASTAVDADGRARDKTLRTIEAWVPMTLMAPLAEVDASGGDRVNWEQLGTCVRLFLRNAGTSRNRGLGRLDARIQMGGPT